MKIRIETAFMDDKEFTVGDDIKVKTGTKGDEIEIEGKLSKISEDAIGVYVKEFRGKKIDEFVYYSDAEIFSIKKLEG